MIAADIFPPESGGPATYAVTLANELVKKGDDVIVVSLNPKSDKSILDNRVKLYPVFCQQKFLRYAHYFWLLFWQARKCDVVYAMGPVNAGWPASIIAHRLKKKFVVKVVGDYAWEQGQIRFGVKDGIDDFQGKNNYGFFVQCFKWIESFTVKQADKVIAPSQYLKKIVLGWGAREKNIGIIYNEVEFKIAEPIKHDGEKWLVSVGRLMPWKGMDVLIDVIFDISGKFPQAGWKLKIIGDGPEMNNLKKKVTGNHLTDVVQLVGNLSHDKTLDYIASADVFILNSAYEGFSHVLMEAYNQGVPVLASRAGGNEEMVSGDYLFEYNDKEEIKNKILSKSLDEKREKIPHRFPTNMIDDTKKILEKLCAD